MRPFGRRLSWLISRSWRTVRNLSLRSYTRYYCLSRNIAVGNGTVIHPGAKISRSSGGNIVIGKNCEFFSGCIIAPYGGLIDIGDHVSVNPYSVLYGHGGLVIGNGTRIATQVVIIPANHLMDPDIPIHQQGLSMEGIKIGNDVWIAAGARILDGAVIADSCVIAAGAVVLGSTSSEQFDIYGGVPARKIGSRSNLRDSA